MLAYAALVWLALGALAWPASALAAPSGRLATAGGAAKGSVLPAQGQAETVRAAQAHGQAQESEGVLSMVARLVNFLVLVGGLGYLLKTPLANYLQKRGAHIRRDLAEAEEMRQSATRQIAEIAAKLEALPRDLEALRTRGREEVAAEDARIRKIADAERTRLLEQTRREIDLQVRVARQELMREAADLAVGVAATRIRASLTPDGHMRLVDRYAAQVQAAGHDRAGGPRA